jgi:hypothetical protein
MPEAGRCFVPLSRMLYVDSLDGYDCEGITLRNEGLAKVTGCSQNPRIHPEEFGRRPIGGHWLALSHAFFEVPANVPLDGHVGLSLVLPFAVTLGKCIAPGRPAISVFFQGYGVRRHRPISSPG